MQFHHHGYVSGEPRIQDAAGSGIDRPADLPDEVDVLIVGTGPGSFTGLRVGLVTARTLGFVLEIPVDGLCSLDVIAVQAVDTGAVSGDFRVATDARRKEVYLASYEGSGRRRAGPDKGDAPTPAPPRRVATTSRPPADVAAAVVETRRRRAKTVSTSGPRRSTPPVRSCSTRTRPGSRATAIRPTCRSSSSASAPDRTRSRPRCT